MRGCLMSRRLSELCGHGFNELPSAKPRSFLRIGLEVTARFIEPARAGTRADVRVADRRITVNGRIRRVSIDLRHSQVEFTEFCSLGVC